MIINEESWSVWAVFCQSFYDNICPLLGSSYFFNNSQIRFFSIIWKRPLLRPLLPWICLLVLCLSIVFSFWRSPLSCNAGLRSCLLGCETFYVRCLHRIPESCPLWCSLRVITLIEWRRDRSKPLIRTGRYSSTPRSTIHCSGGTRLHTNNLWN